jgi:hypothetical protein
MERMADKVRNLLTILQRTLELAWQHLQREREERGLDPGTGNLTLRRMTSAVPRREEHYERQRQRQ